MKVLSDSIIKTPASIKFVRSYNQDTRANQGSFRGQYGKVNRVVEVSAMEANSSIAKISSPLGGVCVEIVADIQEVFAKVRTVVINDDGK